MLVQELVEDDGNLRAQLRPIRKGDPVNTRVTGRALRGLAGKISSGKETNRLVANNFARWGDLYTHRQARVLQTALGLVKKLRA